MDKSAIRNFAVRARKNLIEAVKQKAFDIGVLPNEIKAITNVQGGFIYDGKPYSANDLIGRRQLVEKINHASEGESYEHGYNHVMEEVAYIWFNRFIALRYMEVNGYLPSNTRILSSHEEGRLEPDAVREVASLTYVKQEKVHTLLGDENALYKYILIAQCNELADIMPRMFEKIADYTEILLPDNLYSKNGIVYDLVNSITEVDYSDQVEIIGWMYQFYNIEPKAVVDAYVGKRKVPKEDVPAKTQLFTPDWIVKYMVENSLGRLFVEKLNVDPKQSGWHYYLGEAEQTVEVKNQLKVINENEETFDIKKVKVIDPCMGSGHILVYAFDVLHQVYEYLGYSSREIPGIILNNNIYGLDIDDRAGQLAYFALMMKARSKNRRFFREDDIPQPRVFAIMETEDINKIHFKYMGTNFTDKSLWQKTYDELCYLVDCFKNAKEYGSITDCSKKVDIENLYLFRGNFSSELNFQIEGIDKTSELLFTIIQQYAILHQKYDVVVTNPPYFSGSDMSQKLSDYVKKNYPNSKTDMFAVFIEKGLQTNKLNGYTAMITMHSWMFLSSYEKLREALIVKDIINMAHLGSRAFDEIGGEVVQTTAFVYRNSNIKGYKSSYARLVDYKSETEKKEAYLDCIATRKDRYFAQKENFEKIPGMPIAYWVSEKVVISYDHGTLLGNIGQVSEGIKTGNNELYLKMWFEVSTKKFSREGLSQANKWYPHHKGGEFRKWYGNLEWVINWEDEGYEIKNSQNSGLQGKSMYFKPVLSFSKITSKGTSLRYIPKECLFDSGSPAVYCDSNQLYCLGFLNSRITSYILSATNPTLNCQVGDIKSLPIILSNFHELQVESLVEQSIQLSKTDWDSFETSWDFKKHPLVSYKSGAGYADVPMEEWSYSIEYAYGGWKSNANAIFGSLKSNEEELNRIFIEIYGLQDEMTPEVADKDVTVARIVDAKTAEDKKNRYTIDKYQAITSFVSYAVGCMFGRYSPYKNGLIFAGGKWDEKEIFNELWNAVGHDEFTKPDEPGHIKMRNFFLPEDDNIIPITDNDYFEDDIVERFCEFVKVVYGEETIDENMQFIADAIYPNTNLMPKQAMRKYFLNDFYKDHCKRYQKKPIYWMFESGKENGFKALIYMHRYDNYTVARVRTDYLHPLQRKYEAEIARLDMMAGMTENKVEIAAMKKQSDDISKKMDECIKYDQIIKHVADMQIDIDLDDGVKVNYAKFQDIEVIQGEGRKADTMNLLGKI